MMKPRIKKILLSIFLCLPVVGMAQQMNEQDMHKMMAEMTACMQNIDQNEVKALEKDTKQFESEVKGLCKEGKRDEAQQQAIVYIKKIMNAPAWILMRKCTENIMTASMKGMMPNMDPEEIAKDYSNRVVCDEIQY